MALVPATLTITFTSNNLDGCHNIYYRTPDSGPYSVYNITCSPAIGTCTANISIMIDSDGCTPVTYYGYIEACCNEAGELGQVPFPAVTFTPSPSPCTAVNFRCNEPGGCNNNTTGTDFCFTPGELGAKSFNTQFTLCYDGGAANVPAPLLLEYTCTDDPLACCNSCVTVNVTSVVGGAYQYVSCDGILTNATIGPFDPGDTICALKNSWSANSGAAITFTETSNICTLL